MAKTPPASEGVASSNTGLGVATHSSSLAWRIPWTEEPGRLQPMESQRVRHTQALTPANRMTCYMIRYTWKEKMRRSKGRMGITILGSALSRIIKYKVQENVWRCLKTLHIHLYFGTGGSLIEILLLIIVHVIQSDYLNAHTHTHIYATSWKNEKIIH